jgi:hypothetical protein
MESHHAYRASADVKNFVKGSTVATEPKILLVEKSFMHSIQAMQSHNNSNYTVVLLVRFATKILGLMCQGHQV